MTFVAMSLAWMVGAGAALAAETLMARREWGRPACPHCQTPYSWLQWSAVLSLLTGRRFCRACGKPGRWQRLAGELFLAVLWGFLVARYGVTGRTALALLAGIPLEMVLVTDLETRLIPNRIIVPAIAGLAVLGLFCGPTVPGLTSWAWWQSLAGGALGLGVFWVLASLGSFVWGEGALGYGDVKLAAYIGLAVGFPLIVETLVLTFIFGFVGALALIFSRKGSLHSFFPYAPFLVLSAAVTMLWGMEIVTWYFR